MGALGLGFGPGGALTPWLDSEGCRLLRSLSLRLQLCLVLWQQELAQLCLHCQGCRLPSRHWHLRLWRLHRC